MARLKLSRKQLDAFCPDQETIRQFETLFTTVDTIAPDVVSEINAQAGSAIANAASAMDVATDAEKQTRSNGVLLWLSM